MSSQVADVSPEASTPMEVSPGAESWDNRSSLDNYWVAWFLIQSILLPANMETMDHEGGAFRVWDSYDSLLRVRADLLFLGPSLGVL